MPDSESTGGFVPPQMGRATEQSDRFIPINVGGKPIEQSTPSIVEKVREAMRTGNWRALFGQGFNDRE